MTYSSFLMNTSSKIARQRGTDATRLSRFSSNNLKLSLKYCGQYSLINSKIVIIISSQPSVNAVCTIRIGLPTHSYNIDSKMLNIGSKMLDSKSIDRFCTYKYFNFIFTLGTQASL